MGFLVPPSCAYPGVRQNSQEPETHPCNMLRGPLHAIHLKRVLNCGGGQGYIIVTIGLPDTDQLLTPEERPPHRPGDGEGGRSAWIILSELQVE